MSRTHSIYYTLATFTALKNSVFLLFLRCKFEVETGRPPKGAKQQAKLSPKAPRVGPEPNMGPNRVPKGAPRDSQNDLKIVFWGVLGQRCGAKAPQGVSGYPPDPKMEPKSTRNNTKSRKLHQDTTREKYNKQLQPIRARPLPAAAE